MAPVLSNTHFLSRCFWLLFVLFFIFYHRLTYEKLMFMWREKARKCWISVLCQTNVTIGTKTITKYLILITSRSTVLFAECSELILIVEWNLSNKKSYNNGQWEKSSRMISRCAAREGQTGTDLSRELVRFDRVSCVLVGIERWDSLCLVCVHDYYRCLLEYFRCLCSFCKPWDWSLYSISPSLLLSFVNPIFSVHQGVASGIFEQGGPFKGFCFVLFFVCMGFFVVF